MSTLTTGWVTNQQAASRSVRKQSTLCHLSTSSMSLPSSSDTYSNKLPIPSSLCLTSVKMMQLKTSSFSTVSGLLSLRCIYILASISFSRLLLKDCSFSAIESIVRLQMRSLRLEAVFWKISFWVVMSSTRGLAYKDSREKFSEKEEPLRNGQIFSSQIWRHSLSQVTRATAVCRCSLVLTAKPLSTSGWRQRWKRAQETVRKVLQKALQYSLTDCSEVNFQVRKRWAQMQVSPLSRLFFLHSTRISFSMAAKGSKESEGSRQLILVSLLCRFMRASFHSPATHLLQQEWKCGKRSQKLLANEDSSNSRQPSGVETTGSFFLKCRRSLLEERRWNSGLILMSSSDCSLRSLTGQLLRAGVCLIFGVVIQWIIKLLFSSQRLYYEGAHWLQPLSLLRGDGQPGISSAGPIGKKREELAIQAFWRGWLWGKGINPSQGRRGGAVGQQEWLLTPCKKLFPNLFGGFYNYLAAQ